MVPVSAAMADTRHMSTIVIAMTSRLVAYIK
jgi:hypothetical protein